MQIANLIGNLHSALCVSSDALLSVVFSPACTACDQPLVHPTRGPVCEVCWRSIVPLTPPLCDRCGDPLPTWRVVSVPQQCCPRCRRTLRAIVHALKYEGRRSLAGPLGRLMRERGAELLAGAACAVPVPLHPSRKRHRGFNQAADLARQMRIPVVAALRRVRATSTQTSLPAGRRHRNVRDAFAATPAAATLAGTIVLLIDDVSTTGATLDACARVLKAAGIAEVRALTAARVVGRLTVDG
jgi:ComF family protein